jgi:hypothetical protein
MIANGIAIVQRLTRSHRSVQIRFRQWECVLDQFHARLRIVCDDYFYHIKTEKNVRVVEHSQPSQPTARDSLSFFSVYSREWPTEIFAGPRFYFDKHQRVIVAAHNVDFAAAASAEISEQDFITATLQESAR